MTRLRDLGIKPGRLTPGPLNAIIDVPGVMVGHTTLISGDGKLVEGEGPVRTGVTAVLAHSGNLFREKVAGAVYSINGFGKCMGFEQVRERGTIETPIILTSNLSVARAGDGLMSYMLRTNPDIALHTGTVNCVVGECNDAMLNDARGRHIKPEHVWNAIETASSSEVIEGNVGGGTGTTCYQFKGGIGTASRMVMDGRFTVGALVQSNFGRRAELMVTGVPVGMELLEEYMPETPPGSIMIVLATDVPFSALQLERLAKRVPFGLARTGAICGDQSGDFVIAFSTSNRFFHYPDAVIDTSPRFVDDGRTIDEIFLAVIECVEEAVLNSLIAAETMVGRDNHKAYALPHDRLLELMRRYNRLS
ncbi:MAG: P1 family peptidase [Anaerolineae bacterium]|nr:P1 family peptidase [Anaerolineae bacterium]